MQEVARANLIFGLHVHVGIEDRETAIHIMNAARYFLPHILALSTNSPFWEGRNTGLKSYRSKIFERFPRTGIPDHFQSLSEYENYVKLLIKTRLHRQRQEDLVGHPAAPVLRHARVPHLRRAHAGRGDDGPGGALPGDHRQALQAHQAEPGLPPLPPRSCISENKWRAARYGIDGKLIDFGKREEVPCEDLIHELLEFIDDVVDELGSRDEINYIHEILRHGTGADRQVEVYNQTNDTKAVVDYIVSETHLGLGTP